MSSQCQNYNLKVNQHQLRNLIIKCIENFSIQESFIFKILNVMIFISFIIYSPFHIEIFKLSHEFLN